MTEAAPGFVKHPRHRVDIAADSRHVRVLTGDTVIADTRRALLVEESRHEPVWYLPIDDVAAGLLTPTTHSTYCPFKGHASYWSIASDSVDLDNSVWGYQDPFTECLPLKDHVAFYVDRVTVEIDGSVLS